MSKVQRLVRRGEPLTETEEVSRYEAVGAVKSARRGSIPQKCYGTEALTESCLLPNSWF